MPLRIGITLGDVTGVGPEVALKAVASEAAVDDACYVFLGDTGYIRRLNEELRTNLSWATYTESSANRFTILDSVGELLSPSLKSGAPEAARAAVRWLGQVADLCLKRELDAVVTAPVNKESIVRAGIPFVGQTEFFSKRA